MKYLILLLSTWTNLFSLISDGPSIDYECFYNTFLFEGNNILKDLTPSDPLDDSSSSWMNPLINREFVHYNQGITKEMVEVTWENLRPHKDFSRYKVINSKIYGPESTIKSLLEAMVKKYAVPDVDFIYYHHDFLSERFFSDHWEQLRAPVFVSSKKKFSDRNILFIDWYYNIEDQNDQWNSLIQKINNLQGDWDKKIEILFWRGSAFDGSYNSQNWKDFPRGRLVYESLNNNEIDAAFTFAYTDFYSKDSLSIAPYVSPEDHLKYKYLIDLDGVTSTFTALRWKLLSGCLVFKHLSKNIMWYYPELIPWIHFIPVEANLKDVQKKLAWAKAHDAEARKIAKAGREFAITHLMPEHILLYCYKTLCKYAALQKFKPQP